MPDVPDLPEAKDSFEKVIALTIAILAVVLSFVDNTGDNAKTDAIVQTTQAANKWAYFQSKSLKENLAASNATLLSLLTPVDAAAAKAKQEELTKDVTRYEQEKAQLMTEAQDLEKAASHSMSINDRSDLASLLLQVAVVICSVAILVRWKPMYYVGVAVGIAGAIVSVTAFLM